MEKIEWLEKAVELYNKDYSFLKIGKELNVDRKKVSKELSKLGFKAKYSFETTGGVIRENKTWRKYNFNEDYFEKIDSEEKAYWLGFLYADGYVSSSKTSVELSLKDEDLHHICKFRKVINGDMPIIETIKTLNNKKFIGKRITLNSYKLKRDLIDKGCIENKSKKLIFPSYEIVPKILMNHFVRGYIDGDGSYVLKTNRYKNTVSKSISIEIIGTYEFLDELRKEMEWPINKIYDLRKTQKDTKRLIYSGVQTLKMINQIYNNSTVYLDRKYEKINKLIAVCGRNSSDD